MQEPKVIKRTSRNVAYICFLNDNNNIPMIITDSKHCFHQESVITKFLFSPFCATTDSYEDLFN